MECDICNYKFNLVKNKDIVEYCTCRHIRIVKSTKKIHMTTTDGKLSKWLNYELQGSEDKKR